MNPLLRAMHYTHYYLRADGTASIPISASAFSPGSVATVSTIEFRKHARMANGHSLGLYLSDSSSVPRLHLPHLLCFPGNTANSVRELCNRSLFCNSSRRLLNGAPSSSLSFLHKRLREENIRRQWVNIQCLISEIARNRSGNANFSVASWRWSC